MQSELLGYCLCERVCVCVIYAHNSCTAWKKEASILKESIFSLKDTTRRKWIFQSVISVSSVGFNLLLYDSVPEKYRLFFLRQFVVVGSITAFRSLRVCRWSIAWRFFFGTLFISVSLVYLSYKVLWIFLVGFTFFLCVWWVRCRVSCMRMHHPIIMSLLTQTKVLVVVACAQFFFSFFSLSPHFISFTPDYYVVYLQLWLITVFNTESA